MRINSDKISSSEKLSIFFQNCLLFFKLEATAVIHTYLACDKPSFLKENLDAKKTDASHCLVSFLLNHNSLKKLEIRFLQIIFLLRDWIFVDNCSEKCQKWVLVTI